MYHGLPVPARPPGASVSRVNPKPFNLRLSRLLSVALLAGFAAASPSEAQGTSPPAKALAASKKATSPPGNLSAPASKKQAQKTPPNTREAERPTPALNPNFQAPLEALEGWVSARGGKLSAALVSTEDGKLLAAEHQNLALNPASNQKLLTAAVALKVLGPEHAFTTSVHGKIRDGVADKLVLWSDGNPSLEAADLWRIARSLKMRGLTRVTHGIHVDQSYFDDQFVPPTYEEQPGEWAPFRAPVAAVSIARNTVTLNVVPTQAGKPARVWFEPPGFVDVQGSVTTLSAAKKSTLRWSLAQSVKGRMTAKISGGVPASSRRVMSTMRMEDPRLAAGYALAKLLREQGVVVAGGVHRGEKGTLGRLSYVTSRPLSVVMRRLGKHSDNFASEMLLKSISAKRTGPPGTSAGGAEVASGWLGLFEADRDDIAVVNGSGLFSGNRLSANVITRILLQALQDPALGPEFVSHLSVGGVDGTLGRRFRSAGRSRQLRGKTGTLARTVSLSGYLASKEGTPQVAFAFIVDGIPRIGTVRQKIDATVEQIRKVLEQQP